MSRMQFYPAKELKITDTQEELEILVDGKRINGVMKYELSVDSSSPFNVLKLEIDIEGLIEVRQ
ncbi:MAG: hypothetical protein QMB62_12200 [Oscillospiraceae bacterium]